MYLCMKIGFTQSVETLYCVVAYDMYPKAQVHVLILPRYPLNGPKDLGPEPLLRHMAELAQWLAPRLRSQFPSLPPLRCGFHAVPSMHHLHLHLISIDFNSENVKKPRHWTIFNTDYLVAPYTWVRQLQLHGRVDVDVTAERARTKSSEMRCPLTGRVLRGVDELRHHFSSAKYRACAAEIEADIVYFG